MLYYKWANYFRQSIDTVKISDMLLVNKEVIDWLGDFLAVIFEVQTSAYLAESRGLSGVR